MSNQLINSVDRHVKNIYDLLESGNAKAALLSSHKAQKKFPQFTVFDSLEALTLTFLKKSDEAKAVCDKILQSTGGLVIEAATLHALILTLKRLKQYGKIVTIYGNLFKAFPDKEEFGVEWFNASIKSLDFHQANQIAMKLFKTFSSHPEKETLALALVERMIKKALAEGKLKTFQDYSLCLLLTDKDVQVMTSLLDVPESVFPSEMDAIKWKLNLLFHLSKWDDIISFVRSLTPVTILEDWEILAVYLGALAKLPEKAGSLNDIIFWKASEESSYLFRADLLSKIEVLTRFPNLSSKGDLNSDIEKYFTEYGAKESCFADLVPYIKDGCRLESIGNLFDREEEVLNASPEDQKKFICALKLRKFSGQCDAEPVSPNIKTAERYVHVYRSFARRGQFYADVIILAVIELVGLYLMDKNLTSILQAVLLVEEAMKDNDSNFYLRLLMLSLLHELNAVSLSIPVYKALNIKFVQLDMLSFLLFDWIPLIGFNDQTQIFCSEIEQIYENNEIETPDMIVEGYKNGAYSQIPDFVDFYLQLRQSIQKMILHLTRISSASIEATNKDLILKLYKGMQLPTFYKEMVDNRPVMDIYSTWSVFEDLSKFAQIHPVKEFQWVHSTLALFSLLQSIVRESSNSGEATAFLSEIETVLNDLSVNDKEETSMMEVLLKLARAASQADNLSFVNFYSAFITFVNRETTVGLSASSPYVRMINLESLVEGLHFGTIILVLVSNCVWRSKIQMSELINETQACLKSVMDSIDNLLPMVHSDTWESLHRSKFEFSDPAISSLKDSLSKDYQSVKLHAMRLLKSDILTLKSLS